MDTKFVTCAILPSYLVGDPIPIEQHMNVPIDIFGLRKYLERYKMNEWDLKIIKFSNPVRYAVGIDLEKNEEKNMDNVFKQLSISCNVENTVEAIAKVIDDAIQLFTK